MTAEIINLFEQYDYYAQCPECEGTDWKLVLDGPDLSWNKIVGTMCSNPECGCMITWISAEKETYNGPEP